MSRPLPEDFEIHVDPSRVTERKKPSKRHQSGDTAIHHEVDSLHSDQESQHSQISHDEHAEALIHATARAVVARIGRAGCGQEDSVMSARSDESYGENELAYRDDTEMTYGDESEQNYEFDADNEAQDQYDGSASSHHGDDVFSPANGRSNRSSMNSITDEEAQTKASPQEGSQKREPGGNVDLHSPESHISRVPSNAFSVIPEPFAMASSPTPYTPSKSNPRPPFRTPSSVRAMQLSSPTPSEFGGSPRSNKRTTVSRLRTPQSQNQSPTKSKTPTRFKEELPLVLLHVTVLALHWPYAAAIDAMTGDGLPRELQSIRENWKLLQEKLGDTVLERGILLPHPQDSYETLEERLLEALELPVRPRAKILSCGHFMGPDDLLSEEESENEDGEVGPNAKEKWCDICGREVKCEEFGVGGKQRRFRVKVFASNGLMTAGSWAAAWREMERIDVEMVPLVPSHLVHSMDSLLASQLGSQAMDRPDSPEEHVNERPSEELHEPEKEDEALCRREMEEERLREVYGDELPEHSLGPKEEPETQPEPQPQPQRRERSVRRQHQQYGDSLAELLFAAFKVAMRDKRNILIATLSVLVLGLAIRGRPAPEVVFHTDPISSVIERNTEVIQEIPSLAKESLARDVSSMDEQTSFSTSSDSIPETAARAVEPPISISNEVPMQSMEFKAREQPPPIVSQEPAVVLEDPCQVCKEQLALREAASAESSFPPAHGLGGGVQAEAERQTMGAPNTAL